jgi:hypothetical protein
MKKTALLTSLISLGALSVLIAGCSSSGDITDLRTKLQKPTLGQQTGLISGSMQNFTSPQGYKVSASLGSWTEGVQQKTSQGYTVYSSVEGNIISETYETVISE